MVIYLELDLSRNHFKICCLALFSFIFNNIKDSPWGYDGINALITNAMSWTISTLYQALHMIYIKNKLIKTKKTQIKKLHFIWQVKTQNSSHNNEMSFMSFLSAFIWKKLTSKVQKLCQIIASPTSRSCHIRQRSHPFIIQIGSCRIPLFLRAKEWNSLQY
jgi:hypothetical protein